MKATPRRDWTASTGLTQLLDSREAAELLGIGRRKLWELQNVGALPCVRLGRAVRFDPRDLEDFILKHKHRGPSR